jgi:hypothetical protein
MSKSLLSQSDEDLETALHLQQEYQDQELARRILQEERDIELARQLREEFAARARQREGAHPQERTESDEKLARALAECLQLETTPRSGAVNVDTRKGKEESESIDKLEKMGFKRMDATAAIRQFHGNLRRAADWLLTKGDGANLSSSPDRGRENEAGGRAEGGQWEEAVAESELTAVLRQSHLEELDGRDLKKAQMLSQRSFRREQDRHVEDQQERQVLQESELTAVLDRQRQRAERAPSRESVPPSWIRFATPDAD